jgi:hypothetical protein
MLAVVAHDAGGAEVLSSYIRQQGLACLYVLEGPARGIFERKLGRLETIPLGDAVRRSASLLCGTSWQSDLEFNAIQLARAQGKTSATFLEHWVNYQERFTRAGTTILPDEIWTGDAFAHALASRLFSGIPIRLVENPYFEDIRQELAGMSLSQPHESQALSVLYVCEPLREHGRLQCGNERQWGYVEEEAVAHFLQNVGTLGEPVDRIVIRPHPSESVDKYDWARSRFDLPIVTSTSSRTLLEEIVDCDVVVGCQSMAMVVGLLAGKRVVSCIPPGGAACVLPFPEIEHLTVE